MGPHDSGKSEPAKQSEGEKQGDGVGQAGDDFLVPPEVIDDPLGRLPIGRSRCLKNDHENQKGNGQRCPQCASLLHPSSLRQTRNRPIDDPYGYGNGGGDQAYQEWILGRHQGCRQKDRDRRIGAEPVLA